MRLLNKRSIAFFVAAESLAVGIGVFVAGPTYAETNELPPENGIEWWRSNQVASPDRRILEHFRQRSPPRRRSHERRL